MAQAEREYQKYRSGFGLTESLTISFNYIHLPEADTRANPVPLPLLKSFAQMKLTDITDNLMKA